MQEQIGSVSRELEILSLKSRENKNWGEKRTKYLRTVGKLQACNMQINGNTRK